MTSVVLKRGLKIGSKVHSSIDLREPTLGDMMAAEDEAPAYKGVGYRVALIAQCITKVGDFTGPVTSKMLASLHPSDFQALSAALDEDGDAGKPEEGSV